MLQELLSALQKCLDDKRRVKSTSIEANLYTTIKNLFNKNREKTTDNALSISNESIREELRSITNGRDIIGKSGKANALYLEDLGIEISYEQITKRA